MMPFGVIVLVRAVKLGHRALSVWRTSAISGGRTLVNGFYQQTCFQKCRRRSCRSGRVRRCLGGVVSGQAVGYLLDHGFGWGVVFAVAGSFTFSDLS